MRPRRSSGSVVSSGARPLHPSRPSRCSASRSCAGRTSGGRWAPVATTTDRRTTYCDDLEGDGVATAGRPLRDGVTRKDGALDSGNRPWRPAGRTPAPSQEPSGWTALVEVKPPRPAIAAPPDRTAHGGSFRAVGSIGQQDDVRCESGRCDVVADRDRRRVLAAHHAEDRLTVPDPTGGAELVELRVEQPGRVLSRAADVRVLQPQFARNNVLDVGIVAGEAHLMSFVRAGPRRNESSALGTHPWLHGCHISSVRPPGKIVETRADLVGVAGFEPTAPRSQSECATKLRHTPRHLTVPTGAYVTGVPVGDGSGGNSPGVR